MKSRIVQGLQHPPYRTFSIRSIQAWKNRSERILELLLILIWILEHSIWLWWTQLHSVRLQTLRKAWVLSTHVFTNNHWQHLHVAGLKLPSDEDLSFQPPGWITGDFVADPAADLVLRCLLVIHLTCEWQVIWKGRRYTHGMHVG